MAILPMLQDPDAAIARFREAYRKAKDDAGRASAVSTLALERHDKILKVIVQTLAQDESVPVKEACVQALSQYGDSNDAAQALVDLLAKIKKSKNRDALSGVAEKAIEAFSMMNRKVTRPRIKVIHDYLDDSTLSLVVRAVQAAGRIRDTSSIPALLDLMRTTQREIKKFIQQSDIKEAAGA